MQGARKAKRTSKMESQKLFQDQPCRLPLRTHMSGRAEFQRRCGGKTIPLADRLSCRLLEIALELQIDARPPRRSNASSSVHDGPVSPCKFSQPTVVWPWLLALAALRTGAKGLQSAGGRFLVSYPPLTEMAPLVAEIRPAPCVFEKGSMRRQALPCWDGGRFSSLCGRRPTMLGFSLPPWSFAVSAMSKRLGKPSIGGWKPTCQNWLRAALLQLASKVQADKYPSCQPPVQQCEYDAERLLSPHNHAAPQAGWPEPNWAARPSNITLPLGVTPVQSAVHPMPSRSIVSPPGVPPRFHVRLCLIGF
jgi:hypothetical protein